MQTMLTITTYRELHEFVAAFGDGHLNMLVICSRGGLGKSEAVRRTFDGKDVVRIGGHVTPLKLYELLYDGRDKPVVFDEIDGLLAKLPRPVRIGGAVRWRVEEISAWLASDCPDRERWETLQKRRGKAD